MGILQTPLNKAQIELLDLFALELSENDLDKLKQILLEFKFDRLEELANEEWDEKRMDQQTINSRLKGHLRTPYTTPTQFVKRTGDNS